MHFVDIENRKRGFSGTKRVFLMCFLSVEKARSAARVQEKKKTAKVVPSEKESFLASEVLKHKPQVSLSQILSRVRFRPSGMHAIGVVVFYG